MRRRTSRLSVKEVVNKKEPGYYCDGGGVVSPGERFGQQVLDIPLYVKWKESTYGAGPIPYRIPC